MSVRWEKTPFVMRSSREGSWNAPLLHLKLHTCEVLLCISTIFVFTTPFLLPGCSYKQKNHSPIFPNLLQVDICKKILGLKFKVFYFFACFTMNSRPFRTTTLSCPPKYFIRWNLKHVNLIYAGWKTQEDVRTHDTKQWTLDTSGWTNRTDPKEWTAKVKPV